MRSRSIFWILLGVLLLAGAWFFWPSGHGLLTPKNNPAAQKIAAVAGVASLRPASTAPLLFGAGKGATNSVARTNRFAWRLSNTSKTIGQLTEDPGAILLENALIDSRRPLNFSIPKNLQPQGDPGAYIVQARGPANDAFRAQLTAAGAQIVSYIPNNAYLVRLSSGGAAGLGGQPQVQSVIPYEPYYKISSALIGAAVQQKNLPDDAALTLGLFADNATATVDQIKSIGGTVVGTDTSPFGPVVRVIPPADWTALATLPGVQIVELAHRRKAANDLARVTMGISTDTVTNANYMNLTGKNVLVEVNDTGIDATHPDFSAGRVTGSPLSLVDTNGHGTFVAGIIAGNGSQSSTISAADTPQGSVTNADYRGKAQAASLYSFAGLDNAGFSDLPDSLFQTVPATNHALISNNSWTYDDDTYNLAAASYDAAVRDALPLVTGSQPVLFVFAAGNAGGGDDTGGGGFPDSILSPGTAKDLITVGALEQLRFITNSVTNIDGSVTTPWQDATDSGNEVAGYSSRGNVGIGTEGTYGRFKPDVVAPGSFVVSTRSAQWDQAAYYNPTNYLFNGYFQQLVQPDTLNYYGLTVPINAVGVTISIVPNFASPSPFPADMPVYVSLSGFPTTTVYDFKTAKDELSIPEDTGIGFLQAVQNGSFNFAVGNSTNFPVNYDVLIEITTTNDAGNYFEVLSNLNETLGPYYRYESGTSMSAPAVSGTLALMQDYFTNTLQITPSPALLKALLINGSRSQTGYEFSVTNTINLQGWGLPYLPDILPFGLTNTAGAGCASFFLDQSPTNALATGQSQTYVVSIPTIDAQVQPLRVTLAWTDPPGNPAAAIKLVNNLDLVITNLDTGEVFWGNDFDNGTPSFVQPWNTNTPPNVDAINNVENIYLEPLLGANYSVTVIGRSVNVNAVTAQTNNVVQDYALVVSSGDGGVTNAITVTPSAPNPFVGPLVSFIGTTNTLLMNQFAGGNTPLLGTNTVGAGAGYATNAAITIGMTNQWHFYVVTNVLGYTNAAFITLLSQTLATPRMGVFADELQNPTQPEADVDLYVATGPGASALTNLDPVVLSNCVYGINGNGASLGNGTGTEFVAYTNAAIGQVYYIGVKSETQEAAEYAFLPVFSLFPFSEFVNGKEVVNGLLLPVNIPDGSPTHPGTAYVFALAVQPIQVQSVVVSNQIVHQNLGDLVGVLSHSGASVVLNNHNSFSDPNGIYNFIYDQSPNPIIGSQPPDGPGGLKDFQGQEGTGPWILTETDNSLTQTGAVTGLTILLTPHVTLTGGGTDVLLAPQTYFYGYVDVPAGATNLTITATNITINPPGPDQFAPGQLYEELGAQPSATNFDKMVTINNPGPLNPLFPWGLISVGPSDVPPIQPGRYFVTLYNPSTLPQEYHVQADISLGQVPPVVFGSGGPTNLLDDAVMYSSVFVTNTLPIASIGVGLRVDHPRISDLVFHLISPDGTRFLLMENRGATSTNGCGVTVINTNIVNAFANGGSQADTNFIYVGTTSGTFPITYDFYSVPDQMTVYYGTNITPANLIYDTGFVSNGPPGGPYTPTTLTINYPPSGIPATSPYLTIVMNEFGNSDTNTQWTYTAGGVQTNFYYLTLTQDTNLTTTPIKFAPPPFIPNMAGTSNAVAWQNGFEDTVAGIYAPKQYIADGWRVGGTTPVGGVEVITGTAADEGTNYLHLNGQLADVFTNFVTVPGQVYVLRFAYAADPSQTFVGETTYLNVTADDSSYTNYPNNAGDTTYLSHTLTIDYTNSYANLDWQIASYQFVAVTNVIRLEFYGGYLGGTVNGIGPMLDNVSVTPLLTLANDLTYLPEQSLDPLVGTSPFGTWQLEIQDDRVGATNHTVLDSWNLQFVFANTNPVPADINNGSTNFLPAGGLVWYQVSVPTNADYATNILFFSKGPLDQPGPLNMYFSTNMPPTTGNPPGDVQFLYGQTNGSVTLGTNGSPVNMTSAYIVPGGIYYIGLQNTNSFTVQYGFRVDFHLNLYLGPIPYAFTEPATLITGTNAQLNGMATPNGLPSMAWFQWGDSAAYGLTTPPVPVGAGSNVVFVTASLPNLMTNLPYHFRLVVSNAVGVVYGFDQILDEANVVGWGNDDAGQVNVPAGLSNVVAIAAAYQHSLALKSDETAVGWGDNLYGQAVAPPGLNSNLVAVAGGAFYSMALKNNGTVVAWGAPFLGQTNVPAGLSNVVTIAGGTYCSLALKNTGSIVAWGATYFNITNVPSILSNTVAIAGGTYHNLALKNDGTVAAWGDNSVGQTNVPAGLTNVVAISAGNYHSLALKYDGTVVAWGSNVAGQTNVPASLSNVVAIAAGGFHSLALKEDGTVVAWGDSGYGQTNVPVGLTNVVAISAGNYHSLALTPFFNANPPNPIVLDITNGVPQTTTIGRNGIIYYRVSVPTNADFATNTLIYALNGPLNVWFTTNTPPTITNINDSLLLAGVVNGTSILDGGSSPALTPGSIYYLGVNNTNTFSVTYGIEVNFHFYTNIPPPLTNTVPIGNIIYTNIGGMNGYLLTWFAPSNDLFQVQWTDSLFPSSWATFTNIISYNPNAAGNPPNAQFNFFDDGTQTGGFGPTRFYRLILLGSGSLTNTPPVLPSQTNLVINPLNPLIVTNTATDSDIPAQTLTYTLTSTVTGTNQPTITNGVITWTPDVSQAGTSNLFTTVVTDNGIPPLSATNSFSVVVNPVPGIGSVTFSNGGFLLTWFAPTNDIFQVQVATNLAFPIAWQTFTNLVTYTGPLTATNGLFSYYDDGTQYPFGGPVRFYRLQLVGIVPPPTTTVPISSIISTNGNFLLTWTAPTNNSFNVRWTTNLMPPVTWALFPDNITSTNTIFTFTDTNAPLLLKFYQLILLP